jgi:hypothetical protein
MTVTIYCLGIHFFTPKMATKFFFVITKGRLILMLLASVLTFNDVLAAENRMMMNSDPVLLKEEWGLKGKKWPLDPRSSEARTVGRKCIHSMMRGNIKVCTSANEKEKLYLLDGKRK